MTRKDVSPKKETFFFYKLFSKQSRLSLSDILTVLEKILALSQTLCYYKYP